MRYYATLGPQFNHYDDLCTAIDLGLDGVRINLSHGMLFDRTEWLETLSRVRSSKKADFEVIIDLMGRESRIKLTKAFQFHKGDLVRLTCCQAFAGDDITIQVDSNLFDAISLNDTIIVDDGQLKLTVIEIRKDMVFARADNDAYIDTNKSIHLENKTVHKDLLSNEDRINLEAALSHNITSIMQPFVQSREDILELRHLLEKMGFEQTRIYAKIEDDIGIKNIDSLMQEADEIVIARGDLGSHVGLLSVARAQKHIAEKCREESVDFMVVTQLLYSMIENPTPSRAELNDIYNCSLDGASSLMLTGETAIGKYPLDAISYLIEGSKINEGSYDRKTIHHD